MRLISVTQLDRPAVCFACRSDPDQRFHGNTTWDWCELESGPAATVFVPLCYMHKREAERGTFDIERWVGPAKGQGK